MSKRIIMFLAVALAAVTVYSAPTGEIDNSYGDYVIASSNKLISLDLENATVLSIVKLLSQETGFNFIANQSIQTKTITLYLDKTPLQEAMDIIFKANNLAYDYYASANIFVIRDGSAPPVELTTKTYYLKYTRVPGSASSASASAASALPPSPPGMPAPQAASGSSSSGGQGTQIVSAVQSILTSQGKVGSDPVTNSLMVTDIPSQFPEIEKVIASIDVAMPQVMIQVEMLDVSKALVDQVGTKLGQVDSDGTASILNYSFGGRLTANQANPANVGTPTFGTLDFSQMKLALQLFSQDSTTKDLARPRILTLANEQSEIDLTVDEVIGITQNTQGAGSASSNTTTAERAQTGTKLSVTPQVNPETNEITLVLEVTNKESKASAFAGFRDVEERATKSLVRLKDGETLLIGGLIKERNEEAINKTPFLGDVPFVGRAFRYRNKTSTNRELMVFLTPHVVKSSIVLPDVGQFISREQFDPAKNKSIGLALDKAEGPGIK